MVLVVLNSITEYAWDYLVLEIKDKLKNTSKATLGLLTLKIYLKSSVFLYRSIVNVHNARC